MHKLEVKNLKKTIKKTEIIKGISLFVENGEIVGLLLRTAPVKLQLFI